MVNDTLWPVSSPSERDQFVDVLNACGKGDAARWFVGWTAKLDVMDDKNVLGQPSRDAQMAILTAGKPKKKMLKALQD